MTQPAPLPPQQQLLTKPLSSVNTSSVATGLIGGTRMAVGSAAGTIQQAAASQVTATAPQPQQQQISHHESLMASANLLSPVGSAATAPSNPHKGRLVATAASNAISVGQVVAGGHHVGGSPSTLAVLPTVPLDTSSSHTPNKRIKTEPATAQHAVNAASNSTTSMS